MLTKKNLRHRLAAAMLGAWMFFMTMSGATGVTALAAPSGYPDVHPGDWYYDSIMYVSELGIMTGYSDGKFGPNDILSRAQIVTVLYRLAGCPEMGKEKIYPDVDPDSFFGPASTWAYKMKIATGYDNGNFGPTDAIRREQFSTMLYRYAKAYGVKLPGMATDAMMSAYADNRSTTAYAVEPMKWSTGNRITTGTKNGAGASYLYPVAKLSRAECAVMIYRYDRALKDAGRSSMQTEVRIGTMNLDMHRSDSAHATKDIAGFLERELDVVALQEITPAMESLLRSRIQNTTYRLVTPGPGAGQQYSGMLYDASKFHLSEVKCYRLGNPGCDGYGTSRYAVAADFKDAFGKHFAFIAHHLEWADIGVNAQQAQDIFDLAEQYRSSHAPVFVAGDFNNDFRFCQSQPIFTGSGKYLETSTVNTFLDTSFTPAEGTGEGRQFNSIWNAANAGAITWNSILTGAKRAPLSFQSLGISSNRNGIKAALQKWMNYSLDDIMYPTGSSSYSVEKTYGGSGEMYAGASDHALTMGIYKITYKVLGDPTLIVKKPGGFVEIVPKQ